MTTIMMIMAMNCFVVWWASGRPGVLQQLGQLVVALKSSNLNQIKTATLQSHQIKLKLYLYDNGGSFLYKTIFKANLKTRFTCTFNRWKIKAWSYYDQAFTTYSNIIIGKVTVQNGGMQKIKQIWNCLLDTYCLIWNYY